MANSLKAKIKKLLHDNKISKVGYEGLINKLEGHDVKIKEDIISMCAKVNSEFPCQNCPIVCLQGTEESCIESWKIYLKEQLNGGNENE